MSALLSGFPVDELVPDDVASASIKKSNVVLSNRDFTTRSIASRVGKDRLSGVE
jgi:hypothetical protein